MVLLIALDLVIGGLFVFLGAGSSGATAASTSTVALSVISARDEPRAFGGAARTQACATSLSPLEGACKGDAIPEFKYVINIDNTGTTDQRSPEPGSGCSTADASYPDELSVAVDRRSRRVGVPSTPRVTRTTSRSQACPTAAT